MAVRVRTTPVAEATELDAAMAEINAQMGEGVMTTATMLPRVNVLPTGIFTLDFGLLGGVPEGMVSEIFGWEGSGKTTLAMRVVAAAQAKYPNHQPVFVDVEGTFDPDWARRHGCDPRRMKLARPPSGEHAVDLISAVIKAREVSVIILDSIAMLVPMAMNERSAMDSSIPATRARLVNLLCSNLLMDIGNERNRGHFPTVILINQFRSTIGQMHGDPRVTTGGNATKFIAMTRIEMKNKEQKGKDARDLEVVLKNDHAFVIKKAKLGSSLRTGEFTMIRDPGNPYGPGFIDDAETVLVYAKKLGFFTGGGSSWHIDAVDQRFQRHTDAVAWLYENPAEFKGLKNKLIAAQRIHNGLPATPPDGIL